MKKILLPLFVLTQFIFADPPDWNFDPMAFEYQMAVTARVYNENEDVSSSGDLLGAFIYDEIRGVAEATEVPIFLGGGWAFLIQIYDNSEHGSPINFQFYDAEQDIIYSAYEFLAFESDGIVGDLLEPFQILINSNSGEEECVDDDYDGICDNEDDCVGEYNGCGVCNGDYSAFVNIGDQCDCWDFHIDSGVAISIILPTDYCQLNNCNISAVLNQNYFNTTVSFVINQNEYSNYYEGFDWYGPLDETFYENTLYFVSSLAFEPFEYCNPGLGCTGFNNGTGLESGPWVYSYQWIEDGDCQMVWEWDECGGDNADCNNDGVDDICEDEYNTGFESGFFEGQLTGDANHDGELNIVDIVIFIENILND